MTIADYTLAAAPVAGTGASRIERRCALPWGGTGVVERGWRLPYDSPLLSGQMVLPWRLAVEQAVACGWDLEIAVGLACPYSMERVAAGTALPYGPLSFWLDGSWVQAGLTLPWGNASSVAAAWAFLHDDTAGVTRSLEIPFGDRGEFPRQSATGMNAVSSAPLAGTAVGLIESRCALSWGVEGQVERTWRFPYGQIHAGRQLELPWRTVTEVASELRWSIGLALATAFPYSGRRIEAVSESVYGDLAFYLDGTWVHAGTVLSWGDAAWVGAECSWPWDDAAAVRTAQVFPWEDESADAWILRTSTGTALASAPVAGTVSGRVETAWETPWDQPWVNRVLECPSGLRAERQSETPWGDWQARAGMAHPYGDLLALARMEYPWEPALRISAGLNEAYGSNIALSRLELPFGNGPLLVAWSLPIHFTVTASLDASWSLRGLTGRQIELGWGFTTPVASQTEFPYALLARTPVNRALTGSWDLASERPPLRAESGVRAIHFGVQL
ncbi:MAG: hypothetical protein HQL82_16985 [Magnetococcales bacterium]|nr:hypothetical protein [Magnetococcales bacterium]